LTHTQKRKLQRMRSQEKKDQESERERDELFNKLRPMVPRQQWRAKAVSEALKEIRVAAVEE
jgi:ubiquinone biosynthesis protein COQ9